MTESAPNDPTERRKMRVQIGIVVVTLASLIIASWVAQ
jgi:hypothetical protein